MRNPRSRLLANESGEKFPINLVRRTNRLLGADQRLLAGDRNRDALDLQHLGIGGCILVGHSTGAAEKIDENLIRDANNRVGLDVRLGDLGRRIVRENAQGILDPGDVVR